MCREDNVYNVQRRSLPPLHLAMGHSLPCVEKRHSPPCTEKESVSSTQGIGNTLCPLHREGVCDPLRREEGHTLLCGDKDYVNLSVGKRGTHSPLQREAISLPRYRTETLSLLHRVFSLQRIECPSVIWRGGRLLLCTKERVSSLDR